MTAEADAAQQSLQPSALIAGRFRVEATLGQGGMGAVYRVRDERSDRMLALKQLRTAGRGDSAAALMVSQFEREYHTLCQLAHPSIIEVYDYGVDGPTVFYTMELLDGQDLRERGRLEWHDACAVFRDVASSLAIMHSRRLLHRDISARNVRCTTAGKAKLIDFGAMAPMGLVKHVVGTAPFVPPEALQLQMLDGRADLYALGALAYWVLTGRYPYPARSFGELPNQWRNVPASPRRYYPELPEALDQLVMELIELDRNARPTSAAEVMERLSGIAGFALSELPEVGRSYLVAPTLIARQTQLQLVRAKLVETLQGKGGSSFLIEGAEGTGRSRLLDACVLEAKLLGATVLRADASDAESGAYGVAKALCERLFDELPQIAERGARPWRSMLRRLLPELFALTPSDAPVASLPPSVASLPPEVMVGSGYSMMPPAPNAAPGPELDAEAVPEPRTMQAALRDFLLSVARTKHLAIVVDDVDAIDSASAALLGALAHGAKRRRLTVLASIRSPTPPSPALSLLRELAQPLALVPFTLDQCETLLRSVFGEAGRLATLNERVFALAGGNPRWTMALCEHLVDTGLARYEAGSWRLPIEIRAEDLPPSLTAAASDRVAGLTPDARELAEALALGDPSQLSLDRYPLLTDHRDASRVYRAVNALALSGVLLPQGDRYRFAQQGTAEALVAGIGPERERELHGRLALASDNASDIVRPAYHLLHAGQDRAGLERIRALRDTPRAMLSKILPETLAVAAQAAERQQASQLVQLDIRLGVLGISVARADYPRFKHYASGLLQRFVRDSGLADYLELPDTLDPEQRLSEAQNRVLDRYALAPDRERGFAPLEAALCLRMVVSSFVGMAATTQELELVEQLPSLEPLFPIVPALSVTQLQVDYQRHIQSGRPHLAQQASRELLALLQQPEGVGLEPGLAKGARCWELHNQGLFAAGRGDPAALEWIAEIDSEPYYRANARRVRMAYELMHGNVEAANSLRRRAELFALEDGIASILPGTSTRLELLVYSNTDDIIGVKRTMERLEIMATHFAGWRPTFDIARSQYQRIQGDLPAAQATLAGALAAMAPGRHVDWGLAAKLHVGLLIEQNRADEAIAQAGRYIADCEQHGLDPSRTALLRPLAEAYTRAGRLDDALRTIEEHLRIIQAQQVRGLTLGLAYEARARIAIAANDEAGVRSYAELCAQEYKGARNPMLSAKYKGLMREAESAGLAITTGLQHALGSTNMSLRGEVSRATQMADHTLSSRLLGCVDRNERAREGLRLLLEATGAQGGFLFDVDSGDLQLLASVEEGAPSAALLRMLESCASADADASGDVATNFEVDNAEPAAMPSFTDAAGRVYEPMSLGGPREQTGGAALMAVLRYSTPERTLVRRELLEALVEALTES